MKFNIWVVLAVISICFSSPVSADDKTDEVAKLFADWDSKDTPGAAVAVIKNGNVVLKKCFGMANLEDSVPVTNKSVFRIASTSKQFTGFAVARLIGRGVISLDDKLSKFYPSAPDHFKNITIGNLVFQTSGIRDYDLIYQMAGVRAYDYYNMKETIARIFRQKHLLFVPGEEHSYSNSNYILLADIVERLTGESFRQFLQREVFSPLGMNNSLVADNNQEIIKNRARGYQTARTGFALDMTLQETYGDGAVFTTIDDLILWANELDNKTLGEDLHKLFTTAGSLNNGKKN